MTQNQSLERNAEAAGDCIEVGSGWTPLGSTEKTTAGHLPAVRKGGPSQWLPTKHANAVKCKGNTLGERSSGSRVRVLILRKRLR
jgi:hypothetical protein